MEYGIKLPSGAWIEFLSEYNNNKKILTFNSKEDAEIHAQNLELKNFIVEIYNDTKPTIRV